MAESQEAESGWIAATKRPDGTWRKARRVKEGYVPPDEAEKYESKGKQWLKSIPTSPPGAGEAADADEEKAVKISKNRKKNEKKKQQRKEKREQTVGYEEGVKNDSVEVVRVKLSCAKVSTKDDKDSPHVSLDDEATGKKIKNLKKKLRQIEDLQSKVVSGEVKELTNEQQGKLRRKSDLEKELKILERT